LREDIFTLMVAFRSMLLRMRNISDKVLEKIETHILGSITFFRQSCLLWDIVEKSCTARQATDDTVVPGHCRLENEG